ncbi:unnamed protein product [Clavelina lepadiformis]|uniref:Uncharacterized protein n=1 Tax=Clavelina lepadiformis TaxID=159417 RepID=A0ABP0H297_CLALP
MSTFIDFRRRIGFIRSGAESTTLYSDYLTLVLQRLLLPSTKLHNAMAEQLGNNSVDTTCNWWTVGGKIISNNDDIYHK